MDLPDGFHHASISQLSGAELTVKGQGLLELVGFDAPDEERLAQAQRPHEGLQGLAELDAESGRLLASLSRLKWQEQNEAIKHSTNITDLIAAAKITH